MAKEKKLDWGEPPKQIDVDGVIFDLKSVMARCYPYHPVHLRSGDKVFELQLVGWGDQGADVADLSRPPTPTTRLRSDEELDRLLRRRTPDGDK